MNIVPSPSPNSQRLRDLALPFVVQASGLTLALYCLTYDMRFTATAEAVVLKDSEGIRILSLRAMTSSSESGVQRTGKNDDSEDGAMEQMGAAGANSSADKMPHYSDRALESRRRRQARREQERASSNPKEKIEAAAAAMAENQKRETDALLVSFRASDKRYMLLEDGRLHIFLVAWRRCASWSHVLRVMRSGFMDMPHG